MSTENLFNEDDVTAFLATDPDVSAGITAEDYDAFTNQTEPSSEALARSTNVHNDNVAEVTSAHADSLREASQSFHPKYQNAVNKVNTFFDTKQTNTPANKKLRLQDKAAALGLSLQELQGTDEKSLDDLVNRKRAKEMAGVYPEYVTKADEKSLTQLFVTPEAVKQLNNSAKARSMKATTFEKFVNTNKAGMLSINNTLGFLSGTTDFEDWAMRYQLIDSERRANNVTTKGTPKLNAMWAGLDLFGDKDTVSFTDLAKYITTDAEGFKAALAEASNSASSIALSIGGKAVGTAAGVAVGALGGPIGAVGGGITGAYTAGAVASMDEYMQNEIDLNYRDANGDINWQAVKADEARLVNKWRIEAAEQGLIGGFAEAFLVPKIFSGGGKVLSRVTAKVPTKVFKPAVVKALAKVGKFAGKAAVKGAEEFVGEGLSDAAPKTLIDFQNGRLDKNKFRQNLKDGLREGVAGAITAGTLKGVTSTASAGTNVVMDGLKEDSLKPEGTAKAKPDVEADFTDTTESKPHNERNPEERAASEYKTAQAEETLETASQLDDDADAAERLEGMTDREKVALIDSANTPSTTTEDGVVIEGSPAEAIVNGADIETLLGDDVAELQSVLVEERQSELAQAIRAGEDFTFTYGEWTVAASKLKAKHPTINHLVINTDTEMPGYEAVSHLSEVLDLLQAQYDSLAVPAVESTPPATPGISAEMAADPNPAAISSRKQTGIVQEVTPTGNINQVKLKLIDGTEHTIDLYDTESAVDIQGIADKLSAQFAKALKASGNTPSIVREASLQGIPVIMRVLIKRAKALNVPIGDMAKSITFKSDQSAGSAYIAAILGSDRLVYGVGRQAQRVSTVIHEFAHAILHFMTVDWANLDAQKQAGTITPEGLEYLTAIEATAKLLGLKDISDVNDLSNTTLTNPKTGKVQTRTQSNQPLTYRTVIHEKLATTMEVFLKEGHLKTDAMEAEIAKILLYWRALIPSEVLTRKASYAANEGWEYSGEYHQALDATDDVGEVFHSMYAVNQQIDKTTVPMFNFSFFPVEILGKGGQMILDKVIASKHTAIAKVFAKLYSDSINARTQINTPEAITKMNKDLADTFKATFAGELLESINQLGLRIPESVSKDLHNIQEFIQRYNPDKVPYVQDANLDHIEIILSENTDAFDPGDDVHTVIGRIAGTFATTKTDIYQKTLEELGYVTDDKVKQASEEMLAKTLPTILNDQFTQLVQAYPAEAKQLFAAYIKNGKVSSRIANKHVTIAAQEKLDNMTIKDLRIKALIKNVRDASTDVVNYFNQGKYIDALIAKYDELTKSEMLRLGPDVIKKVESATQSLHTFGSLSFVYQNAGDVHPETMQYLRDVLNAIAAKSPVPFITIDNLDPMLNAFVDVETKRMVNEIAGKKLDSVAAVIAMGDYAKLMSQVARGASQLEKEEREFVTQEHVNLAKIAVLDSKKIWDMRSWLPQANSVHEVFSTYFPSEKAYRDSAIADIIYDVVKGESQATNEAEVVATKLKKFAKKSLSKKLEPIKLPNSGLEVQSRDELISVLLYMGSESGKDTFMRTHKLVKVDPITGTAITKDAELQADLDDLAANGTITADDIAFANAIWAEFVPLLKMIQDVYRRDRGIQVGEVKAVPFTVGGHALTGGYFPISYNEVMKVGDNAKAESLFYNVFSMKTFRRVKERGEGKTTPVKLGLGPVISYANMALREYHIKPKMALFKAFVNDPEVNEHIKATRPGALQDPVKSGPNTHETGIINDWVSTVDNQVRGDIDPNTPKFVNMLLRNTSFVFYSVDAIAAVTNTVAGLPAAIPYTTSNMRLALNVMSWPLTIRRANKRSNLSQVMKSNERQFVQFVLSENTEQLYSNATSAKDFMNTAAMTFQKTSQHVLERIVWNTEYETQMARGMHPEGAVKHADMVTERVLGRYAESNRSLGQKAGVFGRFTNIAAQHLYTFKRQFNVELKRDGPAWRKAYMSSLIIASALASTRIALELTDWATPDKPREEEDKKKLRMQVQMYSEMLPYFLGPFGRILSASINIAGGSDVSITPVEHTIKQVLRGAPKLAVTAGTDYKMGARDYADVFGMLTMVSGVPFSGISNVNDFITAFRDHDEIALTRLEEDAERRAYTRQFGEEYNPLID